MVSTYGIPVDYYVFPFDFYHSRKNVQKFEELDAIHDFLLNGTMPSFEDITDKKKLKSKKQAFVKKTDAYKLENHACKFYF